MQLDEIIRTRHSVRKYDGSTIPTSHIALILEAANRAPSAGNLQSYRIFVATGSEKKREIASCAFEQEFIADASACFVFSADPLISSSEYGSRGEDLYSIQDATIAAAFALLKAVDLGYGTTWIGSFDVKRLSLLTGGKNLVPIAIILVGTPMGETSATSRKKVSEVAAFIG